MDLLIAILTLVLLLAVILVISAPLRAARRPGEIVISGEQAADRAELEAAREAKYREIRDAELDYRTGKLSDGDFAATDGALRAEAIEILDRLRAQDSEPG